MNYKNIIKQLDYWPNSILSWKYVKYIKIKINLTWPYLTIHLTSTLIRDQARTWFWIDQKVGSPESTPFGLIYIFNIVHYFSTATVAGAPRQLYYVAMTWSDSRWRSGDRSTAWKLPSNDQRCDLLPRLVPILEKILFLVSLVVRFGLHKVYFVLL